MGQVLARVVPEFEFGYDLFSLRPRHYLDSEVDKAVSLLPVLFDLFDRGIPPAWLVADFGYVAKHVMLMGSWRLMKEHRAKKGAVEK